MKRQDLIESLANIGRNPLRLSKLSNDHLRELMVQESDKLAEYAANQSRLESQRAEARRNREIKAAKLQRRRQQTAHEAKLQAEAEQFRQQVISKPLPPICTNRLVAAELRIPQLKVVRTMIEQRQQQKSALVPLLREGRAGVRLARPHHQGHR